MARKLDDEEKQDEPKVLANTTARKARLLEGFEKLYKLRREKEELEEKHLSEVKAAIKEERGHIKADLDVTSKDMDLMFKLYERDRLAKEFEDEGDRDAIHDNLKEMWGYLSDGETLNFLGALDQAA